MKRVPFLFFFLLFITSELKAQDLNFGIKGGLNYSNFISNEIYADFSSKSSFHFGAFLELPMKGKLSFHPELLYSRQGARLRVELQNFGSLEPVFLSPEYVNFNDNYIQLPLLFRLNFSQTFSFDFGPQIGVLASKGLRLDFGPTLGFGLDIADKFKVQLRYYLGVSDLLRKTTLGNVEFNEDRFDSVFQLSVGYVIF